jgi:hypothetical protein
MEFTERIDVNASNWLLSQLSDNFLKQNFLEGETDERFRLTPVKKVLQKYNKSQGIGKVKYYKKDEFGLLRDYGDGIQSLPTKFRGLICKGMTDVDMVNCHPIILFNLCEKHNVPCPYLKYYCENRAECLEKYTSKTTIMESMNASWNIKKISAWMNTFDVEMKSIQKALIALPEYEQQKELAKRSNLKKKKNNLEGAFISNLVTTYEVQILQKCIEYSRLNHIEIGVLMYDGFMFYGEKPEGLLDALSALALEVGFKMEFKYKDHDDSIKIPEDWKPEDEKSMYETLKLKYEKERCLSFIEMNCTYSLKVDNKIQFYNSTDIQHQFENVFIDKDEKNYFWLKWVRDTTRQTFKDIGIYPHDVECPDGMLNLWKGFDAENLPPSDSDITPMIYHIRTLLKTDENFDFFIKWLRNMFQYPSNQSIMIILKGEEGAGKSMIMEFIQRIMGDHHYYECKDVQENLFGRFTDHLTSKVCININETDRREMMPYIEKLKNMITGTMVSIEGKGKKKYEEQNKRHLIMTLNNDNPLPIRKGCRRFWYVDCSEELVGNIEYFNDLYTFCGKKANQRAFYQYLMEAPVQRKITEKDIPITDDMQAMYEVNRDPIDEYAESFVGEQTPQDNYDNYKEFMRISGLKYEISKKSFEMKFNKRMEKYGIEKKRIEIERNVKITKYVKQCLLSS